MIGHRQQHVAVAGIDDLAAGDAVGVGRVDVAVVGALDPVDEPLRLGLDDHRVTGAQLVQVEERLALADPVTGDARSCRPGPGSAVPL